MRSHLAAEPLPGIRVRRRRPRRLQLLAAGRLGYCCSDALPGRADLCVGFIETVARRREAHRPARETGPPCRYTPGRPAAETRPASGWPGTAGSGEGPAARWPARGASWPAFVTKIRVRAARPLACGASGPPGTVNLNRDLDLQTPGSESAPRRRQRPRRPRARKLSERLQQPRNRGYVHQRVALAGHHGQDTGGQTPWPYPTQASRALPLWPPAPRRGPAPAGRGGDGAPAGAGTPSRSGQPGWRRIQARMRGEPRRGSGVTVDHDRGAVAGPGTQ
jgi:hypothetical protein